MQRPQSVTSTRTPVLPGPRKRILIVDDHSLVRHGLAELIGREPDLSISGEASDSSSTIDQIQNNRPDLVIVDISLREGSGLELIKQIKALDPGVRMLVLSMHDERLYAERVLAAGAMGYVNKQEPTEKLIEAIRQVLSGHVFLSAGMADRVLHRLVDRKEDQNRSALQTLSDRELEVLGLIGQGLSSRQIADQLGLSIKTIDTYREHLKTKLKLRNANELIRYAVTWTIEESGRVPPAGEG